MSRVRPWTESNIFAATSAPLMNIDNQSVYMVRWPSGLRRQTKDLVRKGVGSNPTLITTFFIVSPRSEYPVAAARPLANDPRSIEGTEGDAVGLSL